MKKILFTITLTLFITSNILSQYKATSEYIINPEKNIGIITNEVNFFKDAIDNEYGGFYSNISNDGTIGPDKKKSMCSTSRLGYAYAKAYMVTGDTTYLEFANHALKFLYANGWDVTNGGWYFSTDRFGTPVPPYNPYWDPNSFKWSFQQHYALVGIGAMVEATGGSKYYYPNPADTTELLNNYDWLLKGFNIINSKMWDSRTTSFGYWSVMDSDWGNPRMKGFTPTVDGITTNALFLYLFTKDEFYKQRLLDLSDNIVDRLVASMDLNEVKFGFAEDYDNNWVFTTEHKEGSVGHLCKTAWCLARAYLVEPEAKYKNAAKKLLDNVWNDGGYDFSNGGVYTDYNWSTGAITKSKNYWMLEQGFTGGMINYFISDNQEDKDNYLKMADESLDFFMNYFIDNVNGGSFSETTVDGFTSNTVKGDMFKAGYHAVEMAYYTYLYSNLYYHNTPVSLYYYFGSADSAREISLYPIAFDDAKLKIKSVTLNGKEFINFDRDTRILTLNQGVGGKFNVTFESAEITDVITEIKLPQEFSLSQNYPNPFNPTTIIKYNIPLSRGVRGVLTKVTLKIYDILGREVVTLVNEIKQPGNYAVNFNASELTSGTYFYKLHIGEFIETKKMILLK